MVKQKELGTSRPHKIFLMQAMIWRHQYYCQEENKVISHNIWSHGRETTKGAKKEGTEGIEI
jgi:hypothetical protein